MPIEDVKQACEVDRLLFDKVVDPNKIFWTPCAYRNCHDMLGSKHSGLDWRSGPKVLGDFNRPVQRFKVKGIGCRKELNRPTFDEQPSTLPQAFQLRFTPAVP